MIAYRMLYAVAVGLPILGAAHLGGAVLRKHGRPERWIWVAAVTLTFVLPALYLARPSPTDSVPSAVAPEGAAALSDDGGASGRLTDLVFPNVIFVSADDGGLGLDEALLFVWLLASTGLTLRWVISRRRLERLAGTWSRQRVDDSDVWVTRESGPAVAGVLRADIIVPAWLLSLPEAQRSLVLLHEREHLDARDPWLMGLVRVARIVTPWNPVVWALSSQLLRAIEMDCDRRVLRRSRDVRAYCDTLFTISARRPNRLVGAAAFAEPRIPLQKRIVAMTTPPRSISALGGLALLGLAALLVFGSCGVPLPTERDADPRQSVLAAAEDPNRVAVEVTLDGRVSVNGVPTDMADVSVVVRELVEQSDLALVTNLVASAQTPYRIMDEVQRELVEAGALRVVYWVEPASGAVDDPLALVMPEVLEQVQVSQRNVLTLDVQADGEVEVRKGVSQATQRMPARDVEDLWRADVRENPDLIASVHYQPEATYEQVMAVIDALHAASAQRISLWGSIPAQ